MKKIAFLLSSTLISLGLASAAQAGTLHQDWQYSIDAFNDGSGGNGYELKGLAMKETADHLYISITGGTPLTGNSYSRAQDGNIGFGDLLFNFTGNDLNTASNNSSLFGIRFADTNDSGVAQTGLYSDVTAKAVASVNAGYNSLQQYYNYGWERQDTMGDLATKQEAYDYVGQSNAVLNSMDSGTYLGGIEFLSAQEAADAGLDFDNFNATGTETNTFKVDRSLMPSGNFIASLFIECANDGIALIHSLTDHEDSSQDVPEPTAVLSLAAVGLLARKQLRRS
ncbi:MAG: hypothetical protein KTR27_07940 [Leptolyngbyaceae cyanobacterium MAG.088]|nr:hypothetical protein [Leptolyngbyaceae cyanobacterium MAG.088]